MYSGEKQLQATMEKLIRSIYSMMYNKSARNSKRLKLKEMETWVEMNVLRIDQYRIYWSYIHGLEFCLSYNRVITQPNVVNTNCCMNARGRATQRAVKLKCSVVL